MTENVISRGNRKQRKGFVVKDKMDKTVVIKVERTLRHPMYGKVIRTHKKYHVHDEENRACVGDFVRISECRPLSKNKHWRLVEILKTETPQETAEKIDDTDADQTGHSG